MTTRPRVLLAAASVAITVFVVGAAALLGPSGARPWLVADVVIVAIVAVQSAGSDPRDLNAALLLSLPPVAALLAEGSPTWLIGPLATLLLVASELNALSWACERAAPMTGVQRGRLRDVARLGALAFVASLAAGLLAAL